MIALIQRVSSASVSINGSRKAAIGTGILILLGIRHGDAASDASFLARKTADLRIFPDSNSKMNLSLKDVAGEALIISQFTLCADTQKGNRPSFINAAQPSEAIPLYEYFINQIGSLIGTERAKTGEFGADMQVSLTNDGPVTITLSTEERSKTAT